MGILKEFAVNAKTDEQAWSKLEVHKHVCSIGNTHIVQVSSLIQKRTEWLIISFMVILKTSLSIKMLMNILKGNYREFFRIMGKPIEKC